MCLLTISGDITYVTVTRVTVTNVRTHHPRVTVAVMNQECQDSHTHTKVTASFGYLLSILVKLL